ncbi:MAG: aminotransferase class IV [Parvularculaceae bacterium]|nr:aminotransferase class IV [Parvularculaceae bacterium]
MPIEANDRGFLLGDGIFETLRVESGTPLLSERHLRRLARAADVLGFIPPLERVREAVAEALRPCSEGAHSMRITVTRGPGPRGLLPPAEPVPTVLVTVAEAGPRSTRLVTASLASIRRNAASPSTQIKSLGYLDNILARQQAEEGCDDVIMLNTDDFVACTSIGNIFALTPQGWVTPAVHLGGILPGIVREVLLERGPVREAELTSDDLSQYPLARSNSLMGVQPMRVVGGAVPDETAVGRLTEVLEEVERLEA